MSTEIFQISHEWSKDALLAKAQLYTEQMQDLVSDDWKFVLWSTLALELLARAALSNTHPALLADPRDWNNLLYAIGGAPKAKKFVPRSIDVSIVVSRLKEMISGFDPELANFVQLHVSRRNGELHSGGSPVEGLKSSEWLPLYYRVCQVLLHEMNEDLESFLGRESAKHAKEMIAASLDKSAKSVLGAIAAHADKWAAREEAEKSLLLKQASTMSLRQSGHRVECPACKCDALLHGEPMEAPITKIDVDEITEVQQYLPSKFECVACGLRIFGLSQLSACGLGDAYKSTSRFDAAECFASNDPYAGFEPDYND